MITKFILHGGFAKGVKQEDDVFFSNIVDSAPAEGKILLVYFAEAEERVAERHQDDLEQFAKNQGGKKLFFEMAAEEHFAEQAKTADLIYLHGGRTEKILSTLKKFPDLKQMFRGKIIAGDSAGVNVLSSAFYSKTLGPVEGLSLIPIKVICHFLEENKNKLEQIKPDLKTVYLSEFDIKTFEVDL